MDLVYFKKLLKLFEESDSTDLTIEEEGIKIKLSKAGKGIGQNQLQFQQAVPYLHSTPPVAAQPQVPTPTTQISVTASAESDYSEQGFHTVTSPIVGTFYSAPSPESEPFVVVGSKVTKGQTLCIVEAMKLMNEIESDVDGTIEKIILQNGQPVEFNQPLFVIKIA